MQTLRDDTFRKGFMILAFFGGFLAALLWLLRDVVGWVLAVLQAGR